MKKGWLVFSLIVMAMIIAACGESESSADKVEMDTKEVMESIEDKISDDMDGETGMFMQTNLTDEDDDMREMYFDTLGIEPELIASGHGFQSMMNINSTVIMVLEAASADDVPAIKEGLEAYLENQVNVWSQYLPDQYEKVENNIIKTAGNYLIYITYDDPAGVEAIFDSATGLK